MVIHDLDDLGIFGVPLWLRNHFHPISIPNTKSPRQRSPLHWSARPAMLPWPEVDSLIWWKPWNFPMVSIGLLYLWCENPWKYITYHHIIYIYYLYYINHIIYFLYIYNITIIMFVQHNVITVSPYHPFVWTPDVRCWGVASSWFSPRHAAAAWGSPARPACGQPPAFPVKETCLV